MALSPAQRHNELIKSKQAIKIGNATLMSKDSLHFKLLELKSDIERVKGLTTVEQKVAFKRRELLPKWLPFIEKYLSDGEVYQNPIFAYAVIWAFDAGDFERGLNWAQLAIKQGQKIPEGIGRRFEHFVSDQMFAWAETEVRLGHSIEPYFSQVFKLITNEWQVHEAIKAKWFKAKGVNLLRNETGTPAISEIVDQSLLNDSDEWLRIAEITHSASGVKTLRDKISQRLRALVKE